MSTKTETKKPTAWEYSHAEDRGRKHVIFNMADDAADPSGTIITVGGRDGERIAKMLAELLQREGFQSAEGVAE